MASAFDVGLLGKLSVLLERVSLAQSRVRPAAGGFALAEQLWHLAELEAEGYGARIVRLRDEVAPDLADFDGDRLAHERDYLSRDAAEGLRAYRTARAANLAAFAALAPEAWARAGTQEGVGRVTLADLPGMMLSHDRAHAGELAELLTELGLGTEVADLQSFAQGGPARSAA